MWRRRGQERRRGMWRRSRQRKRRSAGPRRRKGRTTTRRPAGSEALDVACRFRLVLGKCNVARADADCKRAPTGFAVP
eukprot:1324636-Rhodomonas_salina.1